MTIAAQLTKIEAIALISTIQKNGDNHFGYSAPYTVLDEKLEFTGEYVYLQVGKLIG